MPAPRRTPKALVCAVAAASLTASVVTASPATAAPAVRTPSAERSVTLITGDRVLISSSNNSNSLIPGPGREHIGFSAYQAGGHTYVLPLDASALVDTGKLDIRLFDVTELLADGYDDASRTTLPL